jgi:hypothetical protein
MSTATSTPNHRREPAQASSSNGSHKSGKRHIVGGVTLGQDQSREAKRLAALILEVLAGARTPTQAATALSLSVPRYYQLEARALRGLLAGCETRPKGPGRNADRELEALRRQHERLQRELTRQQTLVRLAQRSIGVPPTPPLATKPAAGKKRRRRPTARALSAAAHLQKSNEPESTAMTTDEEKTT